MNAAHPTPASSGAVPVMDPEVFDDMDPDDYALGMECANPALQIERWGQEDSQVAREFY